MKVFRKERKIKLSGEMMRESLCREGLSGFLPEDIEADGYVREGGLLLRRGNS